MKAGHDHGQPGYRPTSGFLALVLVFAVFLPVLTTSYGIYDAVRMALDYGWLGESRLTGIIMGGGRFVYAGLAQLGFSRTPYIEDLWRLRAIGVAGLALSGFAIAEYAFRSGWGIAGAVAVALFAVLNPGSAVYGFWSACFPYGFAILMAFYAGILWDRPRWSSRVGALVLMQFSLAIYQPAALYFLVGPFISWFGRFDTVTRPWRALWCFLGTGLAMVLHLLLVRVSIQLIPGIVDQGSRLAGNGITKSIGHVFSHNLPQVLSSWGSLLPGHAALIFMGISLCGCLLYFFFSRGSGDRLLRGLVLLPVLMTFVPALISADNYTPYRLLAPAYCAVWMMSLVGLRDLSARMAVCRHLIPAGLVLLTVVFSAYILRYGIVKPREREMAVIAAELKAFDSPPSGVSLIRPDGMYPIDQHIRSSSEYGAYELSYGGFSEAYLSLIAAKVFGLKPGEDYPLNRIHWVLYPATVEKMPVFYPLVDLRRELQGLDVERLPVDQGIATEHPFVGSCLFFSPSLYLSPEFGLFQQEADDWFFKPGLGWMQWLGEPGEKPLRARDVKGEVHLLTPDGE